MLRGSLGVSAGWLAISMVADGVTTLLLPHRMLADGEADASELGLVTLAAIGIATLVQPAAGWVSDHTGRMPVIQAGTAIAVLGLALLVAPGAAVPGTIVALAGVSVVQAGQQALLPDHVAVGWRGRAGGLKSAFDVAGAMASFVILATLLGEGRDALAVAVLAVALVAGALVTRGLVGADRSAHLPAADAQPSARALLVRLIAARFLFLLGIYAVGRFLLLFVAERFEVGADAAGAQTGMILAVLAAVTVAASIPGGWLADRFGRRSLMLVGGFLGAFGIALLPAVGSPDTLLVCGALMAVGSAAFGSASWAMLADLSPSASAGRLMGFANVGTAGAAAAAGLFGLVVDGAGYGPAFVIAAATSLAGGALAWTLDDVHRPAGGLIGSVEGAH